MGLLSSRALRWQAADPGTAIFCVGGHRAVAAVDTLGQPPANIASLKALLLGESDRKAEGGAGENSGK